MSIAVNIRTLRETRGMSLRGLAEAANVSPATLSQIESNQTSPSVATLEKLAYGLRIPIASFFTLPQEEASVEKIDIESAPSFNLRNGAKLTPLTAHSLETAFEPLFVSLEAGGRLADHPFFVGIESEFVWVIRGRAILHHREDTIEVSKSQAVHYDPRLGHNWENPFQDACELLMIRQR